MTTLMREAYRIEKAGDINKLKRQQEALMPPADGEVQVEVKAIGLNFADIFAILGLYSATPEGSFVPGLEYCGIIKDVGTSVSHLKPGDRVMGVTRFGGYCTALNIEANYVTPLPDGWSFEEGAGYLVQALTAYYGLFRLGDIQPDTPVLINSAAGGVGLMANRMAKKCGAYTIGTIGSAHKCELLKQEGYDDYIVRGKDFKAQLQAALDGRELNLVMECIGGKVFEAGFELLAPQGRLVNYGSARYGGTSSKPNWPVLAWKYITRPKIDPQSMIESNKALLGFNLIWLYHKKELMAEIITDMAKLDLPAPYIGHTYTFEHMHEAIRHFQSGQTTGKVVVTT